MISSLSSLPAKLLIGAMLLAAVWVGGFIAGRQSGKIEQLADTVQAFEKRGDIDAKVSKNSDFELCVGLGGLPDQCAELRRMDATAGSE